MSKRVTDKKNVMDVENSFMLKKGKEFNDRQKE